MAGRGDTKSQPHHACSRADVEQGLRRSVVLDQIELIRLRNTSPAFQGDLEIRDTEAHLLHLKWTRDLCAAELKADLRGHGFVITDTGRSSKTRVLAFGETAHLAE